MPKPYKVSRIIKVLKDKGFIFVSQKGNHAKYRKKGIPNLNVIIPLKEKEVPFGTFRSIVRQSNLKQSDFDK